MATEDNVAAMRRWFQEVWNERRTGIVNDLLSPKVSAVGQGEHDSMVKSPEDFLEFAKRLHAAFPDIHVTVEDAFGVDDRVALRWTMTATHTGDQLGIPASGKKVSVNGMTMVRFANGKIVEGWDNWDQLNLMKAIGAVEVPKARLIQRATVP
jgi:steroid delta-isomerase-like uncharacterized protein